MKIIMLLELMILTIISIMTIMLNIISKPSPTSREKNSPFECGFDPKNLARLPFSLQFFLVAVIFVIFDVELTLLLPMTLISNSMNMQLFSFIFLFFIFILLGGLIHEHKQGSLNWMK